MNEWIIFYKHSDTFSSSKNCNLNYLDYFALTPVSSPSVPCNSLFVVPQIVAIWLCFRFNILSSILNKQIINWSVQREGSQTEQEESSFLFFIWGKNGLNPVLAWLFPSISSSTHIHKHIQNMTFIKWWLESIFEQSICSRLVRLKILAFPGRAGIMCGVTRFDENSLQQ